MGGEDFLHRSVTNSKPQVYRLNTYPVIHRGLFHALLNAAALTPLLERFEAEHGTLTALALFIGRECLLVMPCIGVYSSNPSLVTVLFHR